MNDLEDDLEDDLPQQEQLEQQKQQKELDEAESEELGEDEAIEDLDDDSELEDLDDETRDELKVADEALSQKELNARSLAIRRAIEKRMEKKQLEDDLDFLDSDDQAG